MAMPTHIVTVAGIAENEQGSILLVRPIHGEWVFPGGQVNIGENLTDALHREIKAETGIDAIVSRLIGIYSNTSITKWHDGIENAPTKVIFDFICTFTGGVLLPSDNLSERSWVAKDKVLDFITMPVIRARYQAYLDFDGKIVYVEYVTKPEYEIKMKRTV